MFFKVLILSVFLVAFTMLALGVKLLFNKEPSFTEHACAMEDESLNNVEECTGCEIKELVNCSEKVK
ncbi:MAG: hypothetical protein L3J11_04930 [Draconibacterium sp.]|nr:hypothetical protein [Draconibacterium sp.]